MNHNDLEIVQLGQAESFGCYRYEVLRSGKLLVEIEHLYRGDEFFMRVPFGQWQATSRSLEGGGFEPLRLSKSGIDDIKRMARA